MISHETVLNYIFASECTLGGLEIGQIGKFEIELHCGRLILEVKHLGQIPLNDFKIEDQKCPLCGSKCEMDLPENWLNGTYGVHCLGDNCGFCFPPFRYEIVSCKNAWVEHSLSALTWKRQNPLSTYSTT